MLLYLSLTGIVLSLILLYFNSRSYKSSIYLGIFFLLISLYGLNQYVLLYSNSILWISLFYSNITFLHYLIGPVLYLYIRSVIRDKSGLTKRDLWHFIPSAVYLLAALPYILSSYSNKVEIAKSILEIPGFLMTYKVTALSNIFTVTGMYLSRPISVLFYSLWSIGIFIGYLHSHRESSVFSGQIFMVKWLSALLGFLLLLATCTFLMIFNTFLLNSHGLYHTINLLHILSAIGLTGLLVSPFFFPNILYGLPRFDQPPGENLTSTDRKAVEQNFESEYLKKMEEKIELYMCEFQPYLQLDFNIGKFAELLDIPCHHLAFYFREVRKQSFNDYRNECRLSHAKRLIMEGKTESLTLEAIAQLSGFATRNTFFTYFKKIEGISPGAFAAKVSHNHS